MPATLTAPVAVANAPAHKGKLASAKVLFGENSRYAVAAVHTRFDKLAWFVFDAETPEGQPINVIRQEDTFEDAVRGLA